MNRLHDATHSQNREQAKEAGYPTYYGPPCKYQHNGQRYTTSGACVTCARIKGRSSYRTKTDDEKKHQSQKNWERQKHDVVSRLWNSARHRAAKHGREFTISKEDIVVPDLCPVLGIPMTSPSIDRWDNSKGYTPENIKVISLRANILKGSATIDELEKVLDYMKLDT